MYAGQDWVYEQELTIADLQYSKRPWPEGFEKSKVTKMEGKILAALLVGKTREEIAKDLGITRHSLKLHIQNIRKKRLQMP